MQQWKRRKKGTIRVGYINADGTRDKAELVEMCKRAEADVYFILDTKYQRKDNHFKALETDMREIAGRRGKIYSMAGLGNDPVQGFSTLPDLHWEFLRP